MCKWCVECVDLTTPCDITAGCLLEMLTLVRGGGTWKALCVFVWGEGSILKVFPRQDGEVSAPVSLCVHGCDTQWLIIRLIGCQSDQ